MPRKYRFSSVQWQRPIGLDIASPTDASSRSANTLLCSSLFRIALSMTPDEALPVLLRPDRGLGCVASERDILGFRSRSALAAWMRPYPALQLGESDWRSFPDSARLNVSNQCFPETSAYDCRSLRMSSAFIQCLMLTLRRVINPCDQNFLAQFKDS